jgi:aspartate aminotransferase-like enzyme
MKPRLLTPGPTPVPEETLLELAKQVTFHRTAEFRAVLKEVVEDLQYVYQTKHSVLVLTGSGTAGMEAAIINTVAPGEKALLLLCGRWGERWRNICKAHGIEFAAVEVPYGQSVQPDQLEAALKQHPDAKAVFCTFCETSTGARSDVREFGRIVAKTPALFVVDSISGLATMECRTDDWGIDLNVTGSQKALMLPPGLAYVSVSPKAWSRIEQAKLPRSFYLDLKRYKAKIDEGFDTPFTPANTLVKAQRVSLKWMRAEGIENTWARHARMAAAARAGARGIGLDVFAKQPADGLTVISVPAGVDGTAVLGRMEKKYGVKMANGQDTLKGKVWRLAHMGYTDPFDVLAGLSALELALLDAGHKVEPGAGVAAAQRALAGDGRAEKAV